MIGKRFEIKLMFQSTRLREARLASIIKSLCLKCFNPRAYVRRDFFAQGLSI